MKTVINLSTGAEYSYNNNNHRRNLITTYFLENNMASCIHDKNQIDLASSKVIETSHTFSIGDLCILTINI